MYSTHLLGGSCSDRTGSLNPTSDTTVKSPASLRM